MRIMRLITAALEAFVGLIELKKTRYIDEIEDEIDELARIGSPAAKLRIERLGKRLSRERERTLRSTDDNVD
ncbi:MAG: hypothetical protein CL605_10110 [Altibacter sp.]|uniref:hypothetical protein n=1 Tax=Altibacter sp. TaxID=2024823 RepID=UPI000C922A5C|nr:hypothetical protein [Altibacter sp.]MAP55246.1 hypothetical protein [Altibacter sp.]